MQCGCSDVATTTIDRWEKMYVDRYGHKFINEPCNPIKTYIMRLSISELKQELLKTKEWRNIIQEIESSFKCYLPKFDTVSLFFDKLCMEKRLDELRNKLIEKLSNHGNKGKQTS